jgi:hypothetical protein
MRASLIVAIVLMASDASAQSPDLISADRPGIADSAAIVGRGTWQIESGLQWELYTGENQTFFPTLFRVGLARRLEARIEGNTLSSSVAAGRRAIGLSPISFGAKAAVVLADDDSPGVSAIGRVFPKWGTNGFQADHIAGDLRLAVDWDITSSLSLNPNAGLSWSGTGSSSASGIFAMTFGYSPRPAVSWFVDVSVQQHESPGRTASTIWDGGFAYIPRQNWQFDVSAGARTRGQLASRVFAAVGFAYRHK